ncbi:MAG: 1-phosphofructokinase family hexose kinase [Phycisphaerae bacterium]|nr:1-phosphofructokinase family hexose kinase [Phycisphaerae bacterium]
MEDTPQIITVTLNPAVDRVIEVENLSAGGHLPARTLGQSPGGKGVNVSRVLAAMGVASTAMGFLGRDNRSLFDPLAKDGIIRDAFITLPGRTRENITITDPAGGDELHMRDKGLAVGLADLRELTEQLRAFIEPGDVVIFSGSLPPGIEADDFTDLLRSAIDAGARVAADTSGPALKAASRQKLWLIKPNVAELAEMVGRELPTVDEQLKAARGLAQRIENVLLSAGADGAYLITKNATVHAAAVLETAAILNTVGCGDTLLGAFVAALSSDQSPAEALVTGVAAAAASAANKTAGEFDQNLFETLHEKTTITEISQ